MVLLHRLINVQTFNFRSGQSLIELLIAIGLTALFIPALLTAATASREGKAQAKERMLAIAYLREGEEAVRNVREKGWSNVSANGTYHPSVSGSSWTLLSGEETIEGFSRRIEISDVRRDGNGVIIESGGLVDPSTKRVIVLVSWNTPFPSSIDTTILLTRYLGNTTTLQTTQADFDAGTKTNVVVTNTAGGEIQLTAIGRADWCAPNLSLTALDLPKQGVANAITAIEGRAFAGTGDNASGESFANIAISNTRPPTATLLGTFSNYKTNDVFGEEDYGYIATDTNAKEIVILDIDDAPYTEIGHFNSPGSTDANSVFVLGNIGYMTAGNKFYTFDLSSQSGNRTGSRPILDPDGVTLPGIGEEVVVVGNYAYVAIGASSSKEMQIVDVSDPRNVRLMGTGDADPSGAHVGEQGKDIFVNQAGSRAYVVVNATAALSEFFIFDVSTKTGSRPIIGRYEANGMDPKGVTVVTNNKAIIVGTGGEEYQVINVATEATPTRCGGLQVDTGINGISSVLEADGDAFSYSITGDASSEFKIIEGGPGGTYPTSGTFESTTIDLGSEVAFNRFSATVDKPAGTDVTFHIAASDAVSGSCTLASFTFTGPDGTSNTFYQTTAASIFLNDDGQGYENPGRCLRYRAFLTSSNAPVTPTLYDVTFNYSP